MFIESGPSSIEGRDLVSGAILLELIAPGFFPPFFSRFRTHVRRQRGTSLLLSTFECPVAFLQRRRTLSRRFLLSSPYAISFVSPFCTREPKSQSANVLGNQRHADSSPPPRAAIKSEGRSRAILFSRPSCPFFPSFFYLPAPPSSFLGFFSVDEAARLALADNLRTILRLFVAPTRGSRNPREIFTGLAHLVLLSLARSFCPSLRFGSLARTLFSQDENALSPDKEGTRNS